MYDSQDIAERLEHRFKLGSKPLLRKALYQRLGRIVEELGECAYLVIAEAAADAAGKDDPGKYFAFVVVRRLIERKIIEVPAL